MAGNMSLGHEKICQRRSRLKGSRKMIIDKYNTEDGIVTEQNEQDIFRLGTNFPSVVLRHIRPGLLLQVFSRGHAD